MEFFGNVFNKLKSKDIFPNFLSNEPITTTGKFFNKSNFCLGGSISTIKFFEFYF